MKKLLLLLMAAAIVLSLAACGGNAPSSQSPSSAADAASPAADTPSSSTEFSEPTESSLSSKGEEDAEGEEGGSGSNILIAYFTAAENSGVDAIASASFTTINGTAVGRLRAVADMIQAETGGDLFSIQTSVVYPADGGELINFNVHNGSHFSGTIGTIKELEPGATVVEDGFTVSEQTVAAAQADVAQWVEGLGYK